VNLKTNQQEVANWFRELRDNVNFISIEITSLKIHFFTTVASLMV